jgi:hypothetical protein
MSKMQDVMHVQMRTVVDEQQIEAKYQHHVYADGGTYERVVTVRRTTTRPAALLACGHWRMNQGTTDVRGAKRLLCNECSPSVAGG